MAVPPFPVGLADIDLAALSGQVAAIVRGVGHNWRASSPASSQLSRLVEIGDIALQNGEAQRAADIFITIARTILESYLEIWDSESEIAAVVDECVEGLSRCLAAQDAALRRQRLWDELWQIYRWDTLEHGGFGMSRCVLQVVREMATQDEREWFAYRTLGVVENLPSDESGARHDGGRLALELLDGRLDSEQRLTIMQKAGLTAERVRLLLELGRADDAELAAQDVDRVQLLQVADVLHGVGRGQAAVALVLGHSATVDPFDRDVQEWLAARGREVPPALHRLGSAMTRFTYRVGVGTFDELCAAAAEAGRMTQALTHAQAHVRVDRVADQPVRARLLARLGRFDEALTVLDGLPAGSWPKAAEVVAELAETSAPTVARELYEQLIERWVARGTKFGRVKAAGFAERQQSCC